MKKKFALLLAAAMVSTTVLSGCGGRTVAQAQETQALWQRKEITW